MADDTGLAPKESVVETLCSWPDGLAVGGFRVSTSIPRVTPAWEVLGSRVATPPGVLCPASLSLLFLPLLLWLVLSLAFSRTAGLGSPAARAAFENVSVVQKTIQHGGDGGTITEQLPPVFHGSVRGNQRAGSLVASHDNFQQVLGGGQR
jgi:hypothetical protein